MLTLPDAILPVLHPFATLFRNPTWLKAQILLVGAILAPGQRTVAAALRVMGRSDHLDYARYHEVLNRAVWSPRQAARILLMLLLQHLDQGDGPLVFGIDETLERRRGPKLDFTHFKRHKRGNLQYDGTEWRGVSVHRSWRSIVKNPPTPTTSGYAQR